MGEMVMDGDGEERPGETTKGARTPRHRRSRLARWSMRSIVILIALAVTIAVILQIILWTDLPRRLIVAKLQTALGLRVEAPRMNIAWSGNSTLHDVKISLPLSEQSLLAVPRIEVKHTS